MTTERLNCPCGQPVDVRIIPAEIGYYAEFRNVETGKHITECPRCCQDLNRTLRQPDPAHG